MASLCLKILLIFVSLILPPLAVWIARDKVCSGTVSLNILLTILGIIPGTIHAWIVICCCNNLD